MEHIALTDLMALAREPESIEASVAYLAEKLHFLRENEKVLIYFAKDKPGSHGELMEKAVLRCGAIPIVVGSDWRWKTLLRQAFANKASTIIAPPLIVLGISKLAKYNGTPLYIRNVVTASYPCLTQIKLNIVGQLIVCTSTSA